MSNYMIINLCVDGYNYWIKASAFIRIFNSYDIIFESAEDLIYSKAFADAGYKGLDVEVTVAGKDGIVKNALSHKTDIKNLEAVMPYSSELWDNMKEKDSYAP